MIKSTRFKTQMFEMSIFWRAAGLSQVGSCSALMGISWDDQVSVRMLSVPLFKRICWNCPTPCQSLIDLNTISEITGGIIGFHEELESVAVDLLPSTWLYISWRKWTGSWNSSMKKSGTAHIFAQYYTQECTFIFITKYFPEMVTVYFNTFIFMNTTCWYKSTYI